ncbi:hypothetical protein [Brachybacterium hainanense]|uniref:DUF732 domain-containing protein n=1 Tax=Brachybacterium hainanense TaxID=1541174 RepID=A0ABV6R933_9MICO
MRPMRAAALAAALVALAACSAEQPADTAPTKAASTATTAAGSPASTVASEHGTGHPTSGDFASDLADIGIEVDDVESYRAYLRENLCDSSTDEDARGPDRFEFQVGRAGADNPEEGRSPDVVRLVVAYDCPERTELAERYLSEGGS